MVCKFFDKKTSGSVIKNENISNQSPLDLACLANVSDRMPELAKELHKPIIKKFSKRKEQSPFIDNICGAGLTDM